MQQWICSNSVVERSIPLTQGGKGLTIYAEWTLLPQLLGKVIVFFYNFLEIPVYNANRVYPGRTPRSVASNLGLRYLQMSLLWDARHKWVKKQLSMQNFR